MATYTQPEGTEDVTYFQDVAISPATLADGTLLQRLDTKRYPKVGTKFTFGPTVSSVLPATLVHGLSTTLTIVGDQFSDDPVVTFSGAGITVTRVVDVDDLGQTLEVDITTTTAAALGARNLTVTNEDGGAHTVTGALTLLVTPITVTSATPNQIDQGVTGDITIHGTGFNPSPVASFSGSGITVNSTTRTNATTVVANVTVAGGATLSARNVTVTNADAGTATATGALTITPVITISSVAPDSLEQGRTADVTITGTDFDASAVVTVSGTGVTVNSTGFTNSTTLVANLTVAGGATVSARDVTVTLADTTTATAAGALTIEVPVTVTTATPNTIGQGTTGDITVTGTSFDADAVVTISGTGVTVNSTGFTDSTTLVANLTIDGGATLSARDVTVTNTDTTTATATGALTVTA